MSYDSGMTLVQLNAVTAERDALRAELAALKAQEPVAWQWRRKSEHWSLMQTHSAEVKATTEDSEVRALYAAPTAQPLQAAPVSAEDATTLTDAEIEDILQTEIAKDPGEGCAGRFGRAICDALAAKGAA